MERPITQYRDVHKNTIIKNLRNNLHTKQVSYFKGLERCIWGQGEKPENTHLILNTIHCESPCHQSYSDPQKRKQNERMKHSLLEILLTHY